MNSRQVDLSNISEFHFNLESNGHKFLSLRVCKAFMAFNNF